MENFNLKVAGALIFLGATQFIICMIIAEALHPNYSVKENYISDLGVGQAAPIFNTSVITLGITVLAGAYLIQRVKHYKIFTTLLVLCGAGTAGVGLFPENFGIIHTAASLFAFLFGALSAIAAYKIQKPPISYFSIILGVSSLAALILFGLNIHLGLGKGGMERMIAYPILLWAIGFGGHLVAYKS